MSNDELKQMIAEAILNGKIQPTTVIIGDNVQHKIGKVEAGGVGVQNVYHGAQKTQRTAEPKSPKEKTSEPDYLTFSKERTADYNITVLYQELLNAKWIEDGNPDDFAALFSGKHCEARVVWSGKVGKGNLYALFKMMVDNQFIRIPDGHGLQRIIESHFVDTHGSYITDIDSGKTSKKASSFIEAMRKILAARQTFDD